jgi:hypothetical protein
VPRSRVVKPEFFKHAGLYDAEVAAGLPLRLAFEGLWCVADRAGRFPWKPREIKLDVLPYDPVDFEDVLNALESAGFIESYEVDGKRFGVIPTFGIHQTFHHREAPTRFPDPPKGSAQPRASTGQGTGEAGPSRTVSASISVSASDSVTASAPDARGVDTWVASLGDRWRKARGGTAPLEKIERALASLRSEHGDLKLTAAVDRFLASEKAPYGVDYLATNFGDFLNERAPPTGQQSKADRIRAQQAQLRGAS